MRLGVLSDTHGSKAAIRRAVEYAGKVDAWLHAGDVLSDAEYLKEYTGLPVYAVPGNCDWGEDAKERVLEFEGCRILLIHGHQYGVKYGLYRLSLHAEELDCQVVIYGHSHQSLMDKAGELLILNPGSPSSPRGCRPSCAVLTVENGKANAEIITLV